MDDGFYKIDEHPGRPRVARRPIRGRSSRSAKFFGFLRDRAHLPLTGAGTDDDVVANLTVPAHIEYHHVGALRISEQARYFNCKGTNLLRIGIGIGSSHASTIPESLCAPLCPRLDQRPPRAGPRPPPPPLRPPPPLGLPPPLRPPPERPPPPALLPPPLLLPPPPALRSPAAPPGPVVRMPGRSGRGPPLRTARRRRSEGFS